MSPITGGPAGEWPTRPRVLDADPDTPTACSLCESGGRVFHVHPKTAPRPDTPTACICDGGAYGVNGHPFLVHPDCLVHRSDTPTADAPADTDLRERLGRCHFCGHRSRAHYDDGCIECDECHVPFPDCVLPLVRAQVEAARRDTWDEGFRHARGYSDDGIGLLSDNPYRQRAARGETRQPASADTDTRRGQ